MSVVYSLSVRDRSNSSNILKPREISYYSRTSSDEIKIDSDENLRYYYFPDGEINKDYNLSLGRKDFKDYRSQINDVCSLNGLLKSIQLIEEEKRSKLKTNIVTFRGIMRKLISYAFENNRYSEDLDLRVALFDNQIFIKEIAKKESSENGSIDLNTFTGYKFETLTTLEKPVSLVTRDEIENRSSDIVNNSEEFVTVVGTGIGNCRIILGAEVDGIFDFKEESLTDKKCSNISHYMELKCTRCVYNQSDANIFDNKLFRTWLQCFLVGIPRIIYGFRDNKYNLLEIEEYFTEEVPKLLSQNNPQMSYQCIEAIKWYGKITEWLLDLLYLYESDERKLTIIPFKLISRNRHLQLIEIKEYDEEYNDIVNGEVLLSKEFQNWRKELSIIN